MPLLQSYAQATRGQPLAQATARPDVLFEDFEGGYEKWTVQGKAFGTRPAHGTLPSQQHVSGFLGKGLVNTFLEGDDTTGRLISQPFTIERNYIRFLVGGGSHPTTQIRLIVDGKTVRATSGKDNEHLLPASWDVHSLLGKKAHIEIVDEQKGPWGHINVDQIEFSDQLGDRAALEVLEELLPARFPDTDLSRLELKPEAKSSTLGSGQRVVQGSLGKGQVVVIVGPILEGGAALTEHTTSLRGPVLPGRRSIHPSSRCLAESTRLRFPGPGNSGGGCQSAAGRRGPGRSLANLRRDRPFHCSSAGQNQFADSPRPHHQRSRGGHGHRPGRTDRGAALPAHLALSQQVQPGRRGHGLSLRHPLARRRRRDARGRHCFPQMA